MASKEEIMTFYGRCRCCLEYGYMKSMWKEYTWDEEKEIYGEMLMETFNITWDADSSEEHICETCVSRLRDAFHFKKDVLAADLLLQEDFDDDDYEVEMLKDELFSNEECDNKSDVPLKVEQAEGSNVVSAGNNAEYGEIEYLEEDAELVEKSVSTKEKDTDSDGAPKRKWPRKKKKSERSRYRNYTSHDLQMCIEAIQTKGLTQSEAARMFNIPKKTLNAKMNSLNRPDEESDSQQNRKTAIKKHHDNIRSILTYTTATPVRGHRGIGYHCQFCPKQFPDPSDLKKHSYTHKKLAENYKFRVIFNYTIKIDITNLECKICRSDIDDLSLEDVMIHLKKHGKTVHMDIKNHILPFKFNSEHLKCVICDEIFAYFKLLSAHMSEHYPNYLCEECGKGFVNKHARRTHILRHVIGEFPCGYCKKIFKTQHRRRDHERVVHVLKNKTHKCNYCPEKFMDAVQRTQHEVSMHGVEQPQFGCQYCSKIFESQRSLTWHVKRCHLLLRPHKCQYCGKCFFQKSALQNHLVSHTGEKKYMCVTCGKCYGVRSSLRQHLKTHTHTERTSKLHIKSEEMSTECSECGLEFGKKEFLSHDCKGAQSAEDMYEDAI